jgi:DNA-binding NarL/FixJ family response regulator
VEVLRRSSKDLDALQRLKRLTQHLERPGIDGQRDWTPLPRADYQPYKLSQRLPGETVAAILTMYRNGATTREVGERFGLAHSSVNKLLQQHDVQARRRSPSTHEVQRAVELYEAGLSTQIIAEQLGFGASTVSRALARAGVMPRPRFSR